MEYNHRKYAKKTGKGFVIFSESGAKELASNKKLNQSLKFVGNCTEDGQLEPKDGNYLEAEKSGEKTETASVEDILNGKKNEEPTIPPVVEEKKTGEIETPIVEEEIISVKLEEFDVNAPFKYDDTSDDDFEDKDPE